MEVLAEELGVPAEVLLQGLPERLKHASDGVIIRRFARLGCRADYIRIRDPQCPDIARPFDRPTRVRAHIMPYLSLRDSVLIQSSLTDDHGSPTAEQRQIIITNPGRLIAKVDAYRTVSAQIELLDYIIEMVETHRSPLLRPQLEASVADLQSLKGDVHDGALKMVLSHLDSGNIQEARQHIGNFLPRLSHLMDTNEALSYETYEYLHTSLQAKFAGQHLDLARDTDIFLGLLSAYRVAHLKTCNLTFIIGSMECLLDDLGKKRLHLMNRLSIPTLLGAGFAT